MRRRHRDACRRLAPAASSAPAARVDRGAYLGLDARRCRSAPRRCRRAAPRLRASRSASDRSAAPGRSTSSRSGSWPPIDFEQQRRVVDRASRTGRSGRATTRTRSSPYRDTAPYVGFTPTTPHSAAGWRIEPPVSEPSAERREPGRDRGRRSAARAAGHPRQVVRVARRAERRVLGRRAHRELVEVRLADDHRARVAQTRSTTVASYGGRQPSRIRDEHVVGIAARAHVVLERDRHAGERSRIVAPRDRGVDRRPRRARALGEHEVERVDLGLARVDLRRDAPRARRAARRRPAAHVGRDLASARSRRLAEDARHAEAAVFGRGRGRQHLVAVEARAGVVGRNTFTSGSGCAVGGTPSVSSADTCAACSRIAPSSAVSASISSSVSASRASCATCSTSARVMRRIRSSATTSDATCTDRAC